MDDIRNNLISLNEITNKASLATSRATAIDALRNHWPEYLMEAAELGCFMLSACLFTALIFYPASPVPQLVTSTTARRVLMGLAMGSTAVVIIFSPFGKRSGAHFNPAVTLTYLRLGKVRPWDAAFYTLFQFGGGIVGVLVAALLLGNTLGDMTVNYAATLPGPAGTAPAFLAEVVISFMLMSVVLRVSNHKTIGRWTGVFAGALVAAYITIESPISGMSMNPARTFASASVGQIWTSLWIYFTAPPLGMALAGELYKRTAATRPAACAKLHHHNNKRCIFRCNFAAQSKF
jgi:aquaporin Z